MIHAQDAKNMPGTLSGKSGFKEYYPIHMNPSFGYMSNMNDYEETLFDAKPIVYYSFYNNMRFKMENAYGGPKFAVYALVQPHLRMYSEKSLPVKTPSYRILLGWQGLFKTERNNIFAYAIESGHYSNGQSGCSFGPGIADETPACDAVHATINDQSDLSALLNRSNGNFSGNLTKLTLNFRWNKFNGGPRLKNVHSILSSWEFLHQNMFGVYDRGGFTEFDKTIYPENTFAFEYKFIHTFTNKLRYTFGIKTEIIQGAHPFVEPFRGEFNFTVYPFKFNKDFGLFVTYITGHDNYNYRFIDSGNQVNIGITWDWFSPFEIKGSTP